MDTIQSNTIRGALAVNSSEDLSLKNGYLVKLIDGGSIAEAALPEAITDLALYLVTDGVEEDDYSTINPLDPDKQCRVKAKGSGSAGAVLVLADPSTAADAGKVRALPSTGGLYFSPGIAEEDFVDGQLVKTRPLPRIVRVASTDTLTDLTFTAGGATGPEVEALQAALITILQDHGLVATA